jgi:hypothetical protein
MPTNELQKKQWANIAGVAVGLAAFTAYIVFPIHRAAGVCLPIVVLSFGFVWAWRETHRPKRELKDPKVKRMLASSGVMTLASGEMVVTQSWNTTEGSPINIGGLPKGDYQVRFEKCPHETDPSAQMVSEVVITQGVLQGEIREETYKISVETGFVLFADSQIHDLDLSSVEIERRILAVLKSSEPLSLLLEDPEGKVIGAASESGMGDGQYTVRVRRGAQSGLELRCNFLKD